MHVILAPQTFRIGDASGLSPGRYAVRVVAFNDDGAIGGYSDPQFLVLP
jgi:hypothetical protein